MSHVETLRTRDGSGIVVRLRSWTFDAALALWTASFLPLIPVLVLLGSPPRAVRVLTRIWARGILVELAVITGLCFREIGRSTPPNDHISIAGYATRPRVSRTSVTTAMEASR